eukprot:scaffold48415_cov61-Phaeocystis_antarctica.AAC.8
MLITAMSHCSRPPKPNAEHVPARWPFTGARSAAPPVPPPPPPVFVLPVVHATLFPWPAPLPSWSPRCRPIRVVSTARSIAEPQEGCVARSAAAQRNALGCLPTALSPIG